MGIRGDDSNEAKEQEDKVAREARDMDLKAAQESFLIDTNAAMQQATQQKNENQRTAFEVSSKKNPTALMDTNVNQLEEENPLSFKTASVAPTHAPVTPKKKLGTEKKRKEPGKQHGEISWKQLFIEIGKLFTMMFSEIPQVFKDWVHQKSDAERQAQMAKIAAGGTAGAQAAKELMNEITNDSNMQNGIQKNPTLQAQVSRTQEALDEVELTLNSDHAQRVEEIRTQYEEAQAVPANVSAGEAQAPVLTAQNAQRAGAAPIPISTPTQAPEPTPTQEPELGAAPTRHVQDESVKPKKPLLPS